MKICGGGGMGMLQRMWECVWRCKMVQRGHGNVWRGIIMDE